MMERAPALLPGLESARVLIVDDNRVNLHLLNAILERCGIRLVSQALDGLEALDIIPRFRPDLMLFDLMMPNLDGYEMCRRLRADPAFRDLPVLVQSSLNRPEDRAKAFAAGATDYVSKPINATELIARVRIHLQNRFLIRDLQGYKERADGELRLARRMQERLMPPPEVIAQFETRYNLGIQSHFSPSSELGGDLWGTRPLGPHRLMVWLADFSGHGVGAALHTFRLHALLNQMRPGDLEPHVYLSAINRRLCTLLPLGQFATMCVGVLDRLSGEFRYASAAATRPIVWSAHGGLIIGENTGLPLGVHTGAEYVTRTLPVPSGASLFLYSDAAVEIPTSDGVLDEPRFVDLIGRCIEAPTHPLMLDTILAALYAVGPLDDDLTAVLIECR